MHRILVAAFPPVQSLDMMGVAEVFADANRQLEAVGRPKLYNVQLAAQSAGLLDTSSGIPIWASLSFSDVRDPIDTLFLGSGPGARAAVGQADLIATIRTLALEATRVASVCTGAFALAATGLLNGRRAATHWARCEQLSQLFPRVKVDPDAIFVSDGKFHTSAGGTAGIDLALALVEVDLGRSIALAVARQLVVFLKRPGGQSQFSGFMQAQVDGVGRDRFSRLLEWMLENLDCDLSVASLAGRAAMSPRNFARRFREDLGATPAQFVQRLRIDAARRLLTEGDMQSGEIAIRCGFGTIETMRLAFRRHLKVAPHQFRTMFRSADPAGLAAV